MMAQYQHLSCLRWICHFNVLSCIPLTGSVPYSELASLANVPVTQLRSVCRMLMTSNLLCEPVPDEVAHNNVSSMFITNPGFTDWATFITQFSMPAAAHMTEATQKWGQTDKKNETAVGLALGTDKPLFDFISESPKLSKLFAAYMKNVQGGDGTNLRHLIKGFDWASLNDAVVVDVGGSTCSSAIALAQAFPNLRFVVEDLPEPIATARQVLEKQPESIKARIAVHVHSFFLPQPCKEAQVYLMRMILHDWPDREALTILQNHLSVLKHDAKARLLIMDTVLPSLLPGQAEDRMRDHNQSEAILRVRDLTMMQSFNAKERELSQFTDLLSQTSDAEGCLVLKNVVKPPRSVLSVLEVAYERFDAMPDPALTPQPMTAGFTFDASLGGLKLNNGSSHSSSAGSEPRNYHDYAQNDLVSSSMEGGQASQMNGTAQQLMPGVVFG